MTATMTDPAPFTSDADVAAYRRDGVVRLRGVFADWVDRLAAGVARNMAEPGPYARDYGSDADGGFFGDYCNWRRIPEYRDFVFDSPAAGLAARLMGSATARFFHDHVLVKEPGSSEPTPWHHDYPYYCVEGTQTVSLWVSLDPVPDTVSVRFVAGSQAWGKLFAPRYFKDGSTYDGSDIYAPVPDVEADAAAYDIRAYDLGPGDAVAFDFRTLHGAPGNAGTARRRGFSARWVGDDARYVERPNPPSPPFPEMGVDLKPGDPLRGDWFPCPWPPDDKERRG
jgi:ectoine hydroxylase-related dioxygenase (phytanoyl-CoA dioxygenase family)